MYLSDETMIKENKLAVALNLNNLMLNEDENLKNFHFQKDKVTKDNVVTFYV